MPRVALPREVNVHGIRTLEQVVVNVDAEEVRQVSVKVGVDLSIALGPLLRPGVAQAGAYWLAAA